jgi:hypothetical protein
VEQRPWPIRYEATIRLGGGGEARYHVLTWLGEPKAIALAVERHLHRSDAGRIYDVSLRELGPAPRTSGGLVDIGHDMHDRMEF